MKLLIRIGAAVTLTAASTLAAAQAGPPSPEAQARSAIETRQGLFKLISNQFGPAGGLMRNPSAPFDAEQVARNAARIQVLAGMIPELLQRDTREFKDIKTAALDVIWTSTAEFKEKAEGLATAAGALADAAKSGDRAATAAAAGNVGRACGACHDTFRAKPPGR